MTPLWLHRITVLLAACTFSLIVAGGITVSRQALGGASMDQLALTALTALLTLIAAAAILLYDARPWMKRLSFIAVLAVTALSSLTLPSVRLLLPNAIGILSACAAHSFFALTLLLTLFTANSWHSSPLALPDGGWPSLRSLAWITPAVVLLQVALGAAYRHKLLGVVPHIVWAFAAGILVMMLATFVVTLSHANRPMRHTAIWLLALVCLQVMLGVAAFVMRLNSAGPSDLWMLLTTVTHAATGSLVLGGTALLSAQILRNILPAGSPPEPAPTQRPELLSSGRPS